MKPIRHFLLALGFASLIGAARWAFECLLVVPMVPDPQSPIWVMFSTITSIFIVAVLFPFTWIALHGLRSKSLPWRMAAFVPLLLILTWVGSGFLNLAQMRTALLDSANPKTGPERLRVLADYSGGPGYEIDNRVAKHPNTPPDVLRSLHGRPDQVGTEMCLAQNPNTPDEILLEFANRNDEWSKYILDGLERNPRYDELFSDRESSALKNAEPSHAPEPATGPDSNGESSPPAR